MIRVRHSLAFVVAAALIATPGASTARQSDLPPANTPHGALARLAEQQPRLRHHLAAYLGTFDSVGAPAGQVLVADETGARAEDRAFAFLSSYGAAIGMDDAERARPRASFDVRSATTDPITGVTHVRLDQRHRGLEVFGADIVVHMNARGITGVNGTFVPSISLATSPPVTRARAIDRAIRTTGATGVQVHTSELAVYHDGIISKQPGTSRLAWLIHLSGPAFAEQVFVDAHNLKVLNRIAQIHTARDRCVYTPDYDPANPDLFVVRREGEPDTHVPPIDNLYRFSGQVYDIFDKAFGRDSYNNAGAKMRTVYESGARPMVESPGSIGCPNAYWRGDRKATHYCPGFDVDDVVAHEWAHAYTQFTHALVYQNQPGALNESYSDIWGEVIDLINGEDGLVGGNNNAEPYPNGVRWIVGEDLSEPVDDALALRDMWDPERRGLPAKVSSASYVCTADGGGVHYNSSIPNHAFAMLVDGKTFNGHTVTGIGMDKAAHIYWQAQANYQTRTTGFAEHAEALAAGCADLIGIDPNGLTTGLPIGNPITPSACSQVDEAMLAVEMVDPPVACGGPLLKSGAPGVCPGAATLLAEDWEDGLAGWTLESVGNVPAEWPGYGWAAAPTLPDGRAGSAAFGYNNGDQNACKANSASNHAGKFSVTSTPVTVPAGAEQIQVRFDHYVATTGAGDAGNLMIKVNDDVFVPLTPANYVFNAPPGSIADGAGANEVDNPKKGQAGFFGSDANVLTGSWGTSIAQIGGYLEPGDTFQLRFEFGQDCVRAATGWYVDDLLVSVCPIPAPPGLALGPDYSNPDPDGSYSLLLTRPAEAIGPEDIQEAVIGPPLFADDAETGLGNWETAVSGDGIYAVGTEPARGWDTGPFKPAHESSTFWAFGHEISGNASATMTTAAPITVPAFGEAVLTFKSWHSNDEGDAAIVEISPDGGDTWDIVFRENAPRTLTGGVVATPVTQYAEWLTEAMEPRAINLGAYAGQEVLVRFRFTQGGTIFINVARLGWFVDDIAIDHIGWTDLDSTTSSSYSVAGRAGGTYLYRARTTYSFGPGEWSAPVTAVVS